MSDKETEKWLSEMYKYTRDFDFRRLNKYEDANDDIGIDDLILDYTMLYEYYKERTRKLQKENKRLNNIINELEKWITFSDTESYNPALNYDDECKCDYIYTDDLLDKLKELKGE